MVELLAPVGDYECLKAAVQNGADCVYLGANLFSARASAANFDEENLEKAISYAKMRGVRTNLTLNTLIKDTELEEAYNLAKKAYEFGIDAIIVQDLGLGLKLIHDFPDLPIHASTQMSVHNLEGVLQLQELGFKRVVLARELSAEEIAYICKNSNVEIECFIHGALCISYSGQCLLSSMIGGRSGNRGRCAQPCRLPYTLINEKDEELDKGYILSPRDLCGLEYLPFLIQSGVTSFKIEGRMKTPEYVATATRIYRKYIDLAKECISNTPVSFEDDKLVTSNFKISEQDKKELLQVFNRGLSSCGHLSSEANRDLIYKEKPNNMGLPLGIIQNYNKNKGYITLKIKEPLQVGDTISIENETGTYTISELMEKGKNIASGKIGQTVTIGRMKGNINIKDKVYKMSSKELNTFALNSFKNENRKIFLNAEVTIKQDEPVSICITSANNIELYNDLKITKTIEQIPTKAINKPLTKEVVFEKLNKTGNSCFSFANFDISLDDNLFLPNLSSLNELRRSALELVENWANEKIKRSLKNNVSKVSFEPNLIGEQTKSANPADTSNISANTCNTSKVYEMQGKTPKISVLLNILNPELDYLKLEKIDNLYIPLKYFANKKYASTLEALSSKFNLYIYLPTIIKANYRNIFHNNMEQAVKKYNIKGFVLSNISNLKLLKDLCQSINCKENPLELIANYTFNIYNNLTVDELYKLGFSKYTVSPELEQSDINGLHSNCLKELIVYGKIPLMNINYCLLGKTNKCYPKCDAKCQNANYCYYLKDRLNKKFEIIPDNIQTVTTIYNCKTFELVPSAYNVDSVRIDILHESVEDINKILQFIV